jgi:hypothetical protein
MFEGLLVSHKGTKITEFLSDEADQRQLETTIHGRVLKLRVARQPLEGVVSGTDIALLFIEGKSENSIRKAILDINTIRSENERTAIGVMVIQDGMYPGLKRILDEAFDERCMACLFNGNMDPDAAWCTVLELVNIFESDRSGSDSTKIAKVGEPESSWYEVFSSWSKFLFS